VLFFNSQGLFFYHTQKVGLGVGVKWGRGWLVMRTGLDPPAWSPPVFYKVLEGSIGFTAGETRLWDFMTCRPTCMFRLKMEDKD